MSAHPALHGAGRVATTVNLTAAVAVAVGLPVLLSAFSPNTSASGTKQAAVIPIRIIDAPGPKQSDCPGQTWPYKHAGCTASVATAPVAATAAPSPPPNASTSKAPAPTPQLAVAEPSLAGRPSATPTIPMQAREAGNSSVQLSSSEQPAGIAVAREAPLLPVPPGAEPRMPTATISPAPSPVAATATLGAATVAGSVVALEGLQARPRVERRGDGIHSRSRFRLFGFRIIGRRF